MSFSGAKKSTLIVWGLHEVVLQGFLYAVKVDLFQSTVSCSLIHNMKNKRSVSH